MGAPASGLGAHLVLAAFRALSRFSSADILSARALPPLIPPSLPRATADGFFFLGGDVSPVSNRPISLARSFVSRESFLGVIMPPLWHATFRCLEKINAVEFQNESVPPPAAPKRLQGRPRNPA
jgi:hypothetical protein